MYSGMVAPPAAMAAVIRVGRHSLYEPNMKQVIEAMAAPSGERGTDGNSRWVACVLVMLALSACAVKSDTAAGAAPTASASSVSFPGVADTAPFRQRMNDRIAVPCKPGNTSWFRHTSGGYACIDDPLPEAVGEGVRRETTDCPDGRWVQQEDGDFRCTPAAPS